MPTECPHSHQLPLVLFVQSSKEMTCSALMTGTRELYTLTPQDSALLPNLYRSDHHFLQLQIRGAVNFMRSLDSCTGAESACLKKVLC